MQGALLLAAMLSAAPAEAFEPTGEVFLTGIGAGSSAAFDAERIIGPSVNLTRMENGTWKGELLGKSVSLIAGPGQLLAPNFDVHVETVQGVTSVRGTVFGRTYSLRYGPKGLSGRAGPCSVDLQRKPDGLLTGPLACTGHRQALPDLTTVSLRLAGQAGEPSPPMPQFALALIAVLP